jgi:hypothetical protein
MWLQIKNQKPVADESYFVCYNTRICLEFGLHILHTTQWHFLSLFCWFDLGFINILLFQIGACSSYLIKICTDVCPPLCSIEELCYGLRTLHYALQHFHGYYDSTYLLNKVTFYSVRIFPPLFLQYCLVLYWFVSIFYFLHLWFLV